VACETETLLIRSTRKIIQCPPQRFCRVSYIGFTAVPQKHRDAGNVTPPKRFRCFKGGLEMGRTNNNLLRACDAQQTIKIGM
jgi:hypothetical protein